LEGRECPGVAMRMAVVRAVALGLAAQILLFGAGCKKSGNSATPAVTYSQIDAENAGTVEGAVQFSGKVPARVEIDMAQDPACASSSQGPNRSEEYVVNDGEVANVFVYVKDGLGNKVYAAPSTPVVLDQKGCRYVPHVIGVMAGQPVEFHTSDPTMHNINVQPTVAGDPSFNTSQAPNGGPERHVFQQPETMIPVRCNNHPWMQAYINVAANPFFAVTDAQGRFVIRGLPPGTYTLVAEHEKLGTAMQSITVRPHQTTAVAFIFAVK
jgi:plastocyanin